MGVAEEDLRTEYGLDYNPRADLLDTPYNGKRAVASWVPFDGWNYKVRDQRSTTMINERNNYFHKPIVQLNWYSNLDESTTMATSFYYSGGEGGGSGSAAWTREADTDHAIPGNPFDSPANVDLQRVGVAFEQEALQALLAVVLVAVMHLHGEAAEGFKLAIAGQLVADAGTADLQNIRVSEQGGGHKGIPQHATETGAVIKAHIRSTAVADLHFQGHRAHVGEQLNAAKSKAFAGGHFGGQRFEIWKQRMRQRELRADVGPTCISVVTDLPQGDARRTHCQCTGPSTRCQALPRSMGGASGKASPGCSLPRPSES